MATKKDRLLEELTLHADDEGRVNMSLDLIRLPIGQSRHDVMKNLHDLYRSGFVQFNLVNGDGGQYADSIVVLRAKANGHERRKRVDRSAQLLEYIESQGGANGKWVQFSSAQWILDMDISYATLMHTIQKLDHEVVLDVEYKGHGARSGIKAIRVLKWIQALPEPPQVRIAPTTPYLEQYREARSFWLEHLDNPYISFTPNPALDEALEFIDFVNTPGKSI